MNEFSEHRFGSHAGIERDVPAPDMSLSAALRQARLFWMRNARPIVLAALAGGALAVALAMLMTDLYRSSIHLLVELPSESPLANEQVGQTNQDAFVEGQVFILRSADIRRAAVERGDLTEQPFFRDEPGALSSIVKGITGLVGIGSDPERPDGAIDPETAFAMRVLGENMTVRRQGESNVIRVDISADSPRLAAAIAEDIGEAFIENRENAEFQSVSRVAGWLDGREVELRTQLNEAEAAVAEFRIDNGLIANDAGTIAAEQQLAELNTALIETRSELAERRAAYESAQEVLRSGGDIQTLPDIQQSEIVSALRSQLLDIERRLAEFGSDDGGRRAAALRDEQAATRAQLAAEAERLVTTLRNDVTRLESRVALVMEQIQQAEDTIGRASRENVRLRELERRADAYRILYERYLETASLTEESITFRFSGVEVIDPPSIPPGPYSPPTKLMGLAGLILGGGAVALWLLLQETVQSGLLTPRQVRQQLGLPVLASVPKLLPGEDPFAGAGSVTPFLDTIRTARHRLVAQYRGSDSPVMLVTSAVSGEGKSTLAYALAKSAEDAGQNVLLIDADLRRGGLTRRMGMQDQPGLSEALAGRSWQFEAIEMLDTGVDIIPTGRPPHSPTDLLSGPALQAFLDEARDYYDLIVVDAPPVANLADAGVLAAVSDLVAFVIRWKSTSQEVLEEAFERFDKTWIDGAVVNAIDMESLAAHGESYELYAYTEPQNVTRLPNTAA